MHRPVKLTISRESDDVSELAEISAKVGDDVSAFAEEAARRLERRALEQLAGGAPYGNMELLRDVRGDLHESVPYRTAEIYLGFKHVRQVQKLAKSGALESVGAGSNKRILVASLFRYLPAASKKK